MRSDDQTSHVPPAVRLAQGLVLTCAAFSALWFAARPAGVVGLLPCLFLTGATLRLANATIVLALGAVALRGLLTLGSAGVLSDLGVASVVLRTLCLIILALLLTPSVRRYYRDKSRREAVSG
ncbi:MAG: hypothetical protein WAN48_14230 [Actinomycetes bacterium]